MLGSFCSGTVGCWRVGVSILFLLLRLLTAPTPALPAATVDAKPPPTLARRPRATGQHRGGPRRDPRAHAQRPGHAVSRGLRRSSAWLRHRCTSRWRARRCAFSRVRRQAPRTKLMRAKRLTLIAERTAEVEHTARVCIEDELSTITATKYEVEVSPAVEAAATSPGRPAPPRAGPAHRGQTVGRGRAGARYIRLFASARPLLALAFRDRSSARPRRPWRPPCSGPAGNARHPAARAP